ncbi:radical SAM protein [Motiliproteus sediminis]|uniref:radical SAM protein n=1 Tax=Motiliproteus sediminis TaxID=1468178 RepID=UPI001AEF3B15|nr:radical SAM protein [Motiliproteus sediminis]
MHYLPLNYIEPVFRPPSEARSLILQVTNGCSYNACTFCDMYTAPQKKFRAKAAAEIEADIDRVAGLIPGVERVFLADGDAMALSVRRLEQTLTAIHQKLPAVRRVSAYCLPRNVSKKSVEELTRLRELGLGIVYVGIESGDDTVLAGVRKGETYQSSLEALQKLKAAGIKTSVMVLTGLGGTRFWQQHAINSARLCSAAQPDYLSTLVLSLPNGDARLREGYGGEFKLPDQAGLLAEMALFLRHLELDRTVFRSDHASNYLVLKGMLGRDKERLLAQVEAAINDPDGSRLRPEWARGF